ncbi:NTF2-like protein [Mytilinidion resinicola]|uniref:NTF2-like protein n=1 Tax=Mytilinidion resinicola TaxID=574789 RepID=A0A6A6YDB4_9PEZI|nr:NTF2-like protein [Mytilinidion resinicola]KAF2806816.1 NTF2-like protein [Mytilinidion resinicola]
MTPEETANLEAAKQWLKLWNEAADDMVDKCYAEDCMVEAMLSGHLLKGREELRALEHQMMAATPDRKMEINRYIVKGDIVVVECTVVGLAPVPVKSCAILTFKDGLIINDHSYGAPPSGE